jgi:L-2-hydroxyglutarate oxidase
MSTQYDIAVIGAGIVGLATAHAFLAAAPGRRIVVIEAESDVATHQTGHNSGVIHSGLYYKPGSLKARLCVESREEMYRFCNDEGIAHERCGKIVVATSPDEIPRLEELHRRGEANGLNGMRWLEGEEIRDHEPHAAGLRGLLVRETGIVDYKAVARAFGRRLLGHGCEIRMNARLVGCRRSDGGLILQTHAGDFHCKVLVNCGGLQCDRIAKLCGVDPGIQIIPFRGEYYELVRDRRFLVRNLIYPVPDPRFPFLGVHFTRMIGGGVEAGPNAVLAFKREGYRMRDISLADMADTLGFSGFWTMAFRYWQTGTGEFWRSISKRAFVSALQKLLPELKEEDVHRSGAGVRAQAVAPDGRLLDDFHIVQAPKMIHVLNAPSPGATSSLGIGRTIAEMASRHFDVN